MTDKENISYNNYYMVELAYSRFDVSYIGIRKDAEWFEEKGINPIALPGNQTATIGFCEKEQKWYAWSHRAMFGFGLGHTVSKGDIGFCPSNMEDWIQERVNFWRDEDNKDSFRYFVIGVDIYPKSYNLLVIEYKSKNKEMDFIRHAIVIPELFGRGEWTAETLDDAKQMAIDYSNNI